MSASTLLKPKKAYLDIVAKESIQLKTPLKNQLLILDLNGTLVSRVKGNRSMYVRPFSKMFFDYIFDNFHIMVWSSAQPHSVKNMLNMFGKHKNKLYTVWDRTSFGLTKGDYNRKVVTIKDLDKVWHHFNHKYDATNTILLDDSPVKSQLQPFNCVHPSEFEHLSSAFVSGGEAELLHLLSYLKKLQFQSNVSNYIKHHPYDTKQVNLDKERNSYEVEYYVFSDASVQLVDLRPKQKDDYENVLITNMSNIKV